jgi:hypothetical protein
LQVLLLAFILVLSSPTLSPLLNRRLLKRVVPIFTLLGKVGLACQAFALGSGFAATHHFFMLALLILLVVVSALALVGVKDVLEDKVLSRKVLFELLVDVLDLGLDHCQFLLPGICLLGHLTFHLLLD